MKITLKKNFTLGQQCSCRTPFDNQVHPCELLQERDGPNGDKEFYVHFLDCDKRLDMWVDVARLSHTKTEVKTEADTGLRTTRNQKRRFDEVNHIQKSVDELDATTAALEKEREKLTKVKNIDTIDFGRYKIDAWYWSPYPVESIKDHRHLHVCEFCFKYTTDADAMAKHMHTCLVRHPPGNEIYREGSYSFFEVDGAGPDKLYCQNLCLLSKLFLDHKTLYFDVSPFLFYVLTENDDSGCHLVGYFSKEKYSALDYNLACIMILPPYQRQGFGNYLISFSYELTKREGKVGSPEKPLSDLGLLGYRSYWKSQLLPILCETQNLSIKELSQMTSIKTEDIISTLQTIDLVRYWKGQHILSLSQKVLADHLAAIQKKPKRAINPDYLWWTSAFPQ